MVRLQDHVHALAKKKLDMEKSYRYQSSDNIQAICNMASESYPILQDYENVWPVLDMLKLHLKYMSQSNRRAAQSAARPVSISIIHARCDKLTHIGFNSIIIKEIWSLTGW